MNLKLLFKASQVNRSQIQWKRIPSFTETKHHQWVFQWLFPTLAVKTRALNVIDKREK